MWSPKQGFYNILGKEQTNTFKQVSAWNSFEHGIKIRTKF